MAYFRIRANLLGMKDVSYKYGWRKNLTTGFSILVKKYGDKLLPNGRLEHENI